MDLEYVDAELLQEHPSNPKPHTQKQLEHIANSISRFGWTQPIVIDEHNTILIGHGRWRATKQTQTKVPCLRLSKLSDSAKQALMLVDNTTNQETGFEPLAVDKILTILNEDEFPIEELGLMVEMLGETGERAEDINKVKESLQKYLDGDTKRLVLYYEPDDYILTESRIDRLMTEHEIPMRCDLVLAMILEYERANGLLKEEE